MGERKSRARECGHQCEGDELENVDKVELENVDISACARATSELSSKTKSSEDSRGL